MQISRPDPGATTPRAGQVFVGREAELRELVAALDELGAGRGSLVLIGGEAGIGKSRLADEVARAAEERGFAVLPGRCWEAGGAPAYWPWVQALRTHVHACDPAALRTQLGSGAVFMAQILPELHEILGDLPAPPTLDPEAARFQLFDATATLLRNAAQERPLVFVLDDLHVADTPSLLLLRFLAAVVARSGLLLIGTYRHTEVGRDHPLVGTLAEVGRAPAARALLLAGLAAADVRRFIEAATGSPAAAALVRAVHAETEGNPLFLREIVQLLVHEGRLEGAGDHAWWSLNVPAGVQQVIGRRIAHLSEECNRVLTLASVLGREFDVGALERLSGDATDRLWGVLDEAVAARVIGEVPGAPGRLRFDHALIRDVFYQELTPSRRVRLHGQTGAVLEGLYGGAPEPHLAELAHHFFAAAPGGERSVEKAIGFARSAADRATRLLAFEEAARLYRLALQALELRKASDPELRCDLLLSLGDAHMRANETGAAYAAFLEAVELARELRSPQRLARAVLGYGGRFVWSRGACDPRVVPLLREALAALGPDDAELRARLLARLAGALRDQPTGEERHALSDEAVELARALGDAATLAYALDGRYAAGWEPGNAEERLGIATELTRVAEAARDPERVVQAHHYRLIAHLELGDLPAAHAALAAKARAAKALRQPAQRWYVAVVEASLALFEGRLTEAEERIHGARALHPESWHADASFRAQLFALRREQGRLAEVEELIRRSVDEYAVFPVFRAMLAMLYTELGREDEAGAVLGAMAAADFADLPWDCEWLHATTLLAEVACALGDLPRARTLYRLLAPYARFNVVAPAETITGSAARHLGLLATRLSRWDEAAAHFESALALNRAMGARPWVARTERDYARMLLARGGPGDAARAGELLRSALGAATELGLTAVRTGAERLLADAAVRAPGRAADPAPTGGGHVFRLEGEYWTIRYEGHACRLRDTKGLRYLRRLLSEPGREVHSLDLAAGADRPAGADARLQATVVGGTPDRGDAGPILDDSAKLAYRERLDELREEIESAVACGDEERAVSAAEEREFILRELAGAVGLGGRDRRAGSAAERARVSVTRAIRAALGRLGEHSPSLGEHLARTVRTGTFCSYRPDPRAPIAWDL